MLHAGDDFLVSYENLPNAGLVALLDGAVHPLNEPPDEAVVEVHLHIDVVVVGVELGDRFTDTKIRVLMLLEADFESFFFC